MVKVELVRVLDGTYLHAAVEQLTDETVNDCGLHHEEEMSFLDCPIASRWVLLRAR